MALHLTAFLPPDIESIGRTKKSRKIKKRGLQALCPAPVVEGAGVSKMETPVHKHPKASKYKYIYHIEIQCYVCIYINKHFNTSENFI